MLLAIDVGNTRTKAVSSEPSIAIGTDEIKKARDLINFLKACPEPTGSVIASCVVPRMTPIVEEACLEAYGKPVVWLKSDMPLGLAIKYETPETLGSDRLANVIGALQLHKPPLIVVDCGTATKIEAVNTQGEYLGGAILPGIRMSLRALSSGTGQLPNIEPAWPDHIIGRNTVEAIEAGTVVAHAHAVMGMIRDYEKDLGRLQCVVFTGGDCNLIYEDRRKNALRGLHTVSEPELTLTGLTVAGKRLGLLGVDAS